MQDILDAMRWRYAVKVFDGEKKVSEADVRTILEGTFGKDGGLPRLQPLSRDDDAELCELTETWEQANRASISHLNSLTYVPEWNQEAPQLIKSSLVNVSPIEEAKNLYKSSFKIIFQIFCSEKTSSSAK